MSFQNNDNFDSESYVRVNTRLQEFHEKYPNGRVWTGYNLAPTGVLIMRAELYREANDTLPAATGHSFLESLAGDKVGEYTETVAVGRALAMMGFQIEKSLASGEEMNRFKNRQEAKKEEAPREPKIRSKTEEAPKEQKAVSDTPEVPKKLTTSRIFKQLPKPEQTGGK